MARMGSFSFAEMQKLQRQLNKINPDDTAAFIDSCAKELAARLLSKVIKRTPVGDYSREVEAVAKRDSKHHKKGDVYKKRINHSGSMGGTLRRGWTAATHEEAAKGKGKPQAADVQNFVDSLQINREGSMLTIEIVNPVEYASYVEYGHRTANGKGWVLGKLVMTKAEQEIQSIAPRVLEAKIKKFLEDCLK